MSVQEVVFENGINMEGDSAVPFGIGMDAVGLIKRCHSSNAF